MKLLLRLTTAFCLVLIVSPVALLASGCRGGETRTSAGKTAAATPGESTTAPRGGATAANQNVVVIKELGIHHLQPYLVPYHANEAQLPCACHRLQPAEGLLERTPWKTGSRAVSTTANPTAVSPALVTLSRTTVIPKSWPMPRASS
jgi:hypothetical protein